MEINRCLAEEESCPHSPAETSPQVLLIDLENCPAQINNLLHDLEKFSRVVICYAHSGAKVPVDWLMPLTTTINAGKLQIFKMPNGGKNAADFGICFIAGMLMQQLPEHTQFTIISEDADLDHVINLLLSNGRVATRINIKKDDKPVSIENHSLSNPIKDYCKLLIINSKNRPAKQETLINSIKAYCKNDSLAIEMFEYLLHHDYIQISNQKISYNDKKITHMAK